MVSIPLLAAAARYRVRYVAFSSSCIYPASAASPIGLLPATEGVPLSGYGWSKRVLEAAVSYYREAGLDALVVRPFNMYGATYRWRHADEANVIPALVTKVLEGDDPVIVWGSGQQRRSFLHGRDAAQLLLLLAANPTATLVNLGYEQDVSMTELIELICDVAGRHPRIVYDRSRPEGPARRAADSTLLRSLTGNYEPKVSLREGLAEMVEAYQARSAA
jgi:nucleoside-diphosphate-sugar epimerase